MSNNNNQGEPAILLVMIVVLLAVLGWVMWRITGIYWVMLFRWMRFGELWFINLFTHSYGPCLDWLKAAQINATSLQMQSMTVNCFGSSYLGSLPPKELPAYYQLSMPPLIALGGLTTHYYRWPIAIVMAGIGFYVMMFSPTNKFLTKHTLESLIATQAKMWPILSPIVKYNPAQTGRILGDKVPDKLPLFAEALSPEEWVTWNRIPVVNGIPDRDAARRAFVRQLGPRWNGIDGLPLHMRALMAAFALRGAQKREASEDLLGRLSLAWSPDKGFRPDGELAGLINKTLSDPDSGGKLAAIANQYAWRTTAMLGALRWARAMGGVLAPAAFLWLRAEDRALWYPLNNLGRRSFHSEGAGAMAHFMAEEAAKKPLPIPRVDTAIVTLNTYLHDPDKKPIPLPAREGEAEA